MEQTMAKHDAKEISWMYRIKRIFCTMQLLIVRLPHSSTYVQYVADSYYSCSRHDACRHFNSLAKIVVGRSVGRGQHVQTAQTDFQSSVLMYRYCKCRPKSESGIRVESEFQFRVLAGEGRGGGDSCGVGKVADIEHRRCLVFTRDYI
jgi:hypothetical protein